jgi:phage shock protein PspC (stress-responsive transcriptional regulator)
MQRIIQINIARQVLPIEEDAYNVLKDYLSSLERQFVGDDGREIIEDIEHRIAELFAIRLQGGVPAIDRADVQKVIDTLGSASDLRDHASGATSSSGGWQQSNRSSYTNNSGGWQRANQGRQYPYSHDRLLRDPYDKVFGGVCSGVAHYFDIDPIIIRLVMVVALLTFGIGFLTYIIAWIVIPVAKSREELFNMNNGNPVTFHDISRNVGNELQDLKKRGEQMSRELKDFFSKKK